MNQSGPVPTRRELIEAINAHIEAFGTPRPAYRWAIDTAPLSWLEGELARIEAIAEFGNCPFNEHHIGVAE